MIPKSETKNPKAVEQLFCVPFEKLVPTQDLSRTQDAVNSDIFLTAGRLPKDMDKDPEQAAMLNKTDTYRYTEHCMKAYGFTFTIDFRTRFFISYLCEVLHNGALYNLYYLTYLQYVAHKTGVKHIDYIFLCENVFPYGTPLVKDVVDLCKSIQVNTHHCEEPDGVCVLSYGEAMKSILSITETQQNQKEESKNTKPGYNPLDVLKKFR